MLLLIPLLLATTLMSPLKGLFLVVHMDPYKYCSRYYKKQTYLDTYEGTINIVENLDEWQIPSQLEEIEVEDQLKSA